MLSKVLKEAVQPKRVKDNPGFTALDSIQQAIEQMEQQKALLENQLQTAQDEIDSVKDFRDMHSQKIETWKIQDECRDALRKANPKVQIAVAPWDEYKAALGEVLIRNALQPLPEIRVCFLDPQPADNDTKAKKIVAAFGKYGVEVYSLEGQYPNVTSTLRSS